MASSFVEQYKQLFGEELKFDPLDPNSSGPPRPRLALDISATRSALGAPPQPADDFSSRYEDTLGSLPAPEPPPEDQSQLGLAFRAGIQDVGALGVGAAEFGARKAEQSLDPGALQEIMGDVRRWTESVRSGFQTRAEDLHSRMTPESQAKIERKIFTLDPSQTIFQGGPREVASALGLKLSRMVPPSLTTLLGGALLHRVGLSDEAVAYMGATEGAMSLGGIQNAVVNEIGQLDDQQLAAESPAYAKMLASGMDPAEARQQLISKAQGMAPVIGGVTVAAISSLAGRYMEPVFRGGSGNIVQRFGRGYAIEAPQEAAQGAAEQIAQNIAAELYDADRTAFQGSLSAGLEEGALGGLFGGAVAAAAGRSPQPEVQPEAASEASTPFERTATFRHVFGTGGESPFIQPDAPPDAGPPQLATPPDPAVLEEGGQQSMFLPQPGELQNLAATQGIQGELDLRQPQRAVTAAPPMGQQNLPLVQRRRGGMFPIDIPSAEPAADIEAQLIEMLDGARMGVYLSPDNLANLDLAPTDAVVLEDFDGQGGAMVARDQATADELLRMRDELPMQEVLGAATGAGQGKPMGGGIAVQRRDGAGNVVQESLVANEAEAAALQREWQARTGDEVVVLSADEAILRRENMLDEEAVREQSDVLGPSERQARTGDLFTGYTPQVKGKRPDRLRRELRQEPIARTVEEALSQEEAGDDIDLGRADTPTKAAARVLGAAAKKAAGERGRRVGGFYPSSQLDFKDPAARQRWEEAFNRLLDAELTIEQAEQNTGERSPEQVKAHKDAFDTRQEARKELAQLRITAQPRRKSERLARVAERVSPDIGKQLRDESARSKKAPVEEETPPTEATPADDLREFAPEDIDTIEGRELDDLFYKAALVFAGKNTGVKFTYERGEAADQGAAPDTDEEFPEFLGSAESIPEGAEPLAVQTQTEVEPTVKPVELKEMKSVGDKRWRYTLSAEGEADIVGYAFGEKEAAKKKVDELIAKRNKRSADSAKVVRGQSFENLLAAHQTPSMKRRLVKRVIGQLRRREHGGKIAAPKMTRTAKTVGTSAKPRAEATAFFNTDVLTRETLPKDESVANRVKRQTRAKQARKDLSNALSEARDKIVRLNDAAAKEVLEETHPANGHPTKAALDFRYGRMYFRQVMDFGAALISANNTTASAIKEMERVAKFIRDALALDPVQFAQKMSQLAAADLRQSILTKPTKGDVNLTKLKAQLSNPETRIESMAKFNARLRQSTARMLRLNQVWRKNDLYNTTVGPLMHKIADSVVSDGWPSYVARMTKLELEGLNWALQHWNTDKQVRRNKQDIGSSRDLLYKPVRRFFLNLGFKFDEKGLIEIPLDKDGNVETPVSILERQFSAMMRSADTALSQPSVPYQIAEVELEYGPRNEDGSPRSVVEKTKKRTVRPGKPIEPSMQSRYVEFQRNKEQALVGSERAENFQDAVRGAQANRIIEQFLDRVRNPKLTVEGLVRQEQRLIRAFKELGIWRDTPSPIMGKIVNPLTGAEKTFSIAGPRLEAKKLSKEKARKLMTNITPFRLPKPPENIAEAVEKRASDRLKAETEMFLDLIDTPRHGNEFVQAAIALRSQLNNGTNGHAMLDSIIETTPEGHPYNTLAKRLRAMDVTNVPVNFATQLGSSLARAHFANKQRGAAVSISRMSFLDLQRRKGSDAAASALIHTTLHELTHHATQYALVNDRAVHRAFQLMKTVAVREMRFREQPLVYGLRDGDPIQEFVAEAFSNTQFQAMLKDIKFEETTMWRKLVDFIRQVLGIPAEHDNLLDAVMATTDRLFVDAQYIGKAKESTEFNLEEISDPVAKQYMKVGQSFFEADQVRKLMKQGKWAGVRAPLSLMTLPQIRNEFKGRLKGLDEYYRAFKRRDARNSELLEEAERLSRQWTKLTEASKTAKSDALEFSYLATQATIHDVHPDKPLEHESNKHVKLDAQKKTHAELRAAYLALPEGWQKHWRDLQNYYAESLQRESKLLTLNALRATLTKGANAPMTQERFNQTFTFERMDELDTKEKLETVLSPMLEPDMIATIASMRTLPQKRTGPYFPIMRYGDFVVEASRDVETKTFDSLPAARAWAAEQLAVDPTLEITVKGAEVGDGAIAKVVEKAFLLAESATEAQLKRDELVNEYGEENVSAVTKKLEYGQASTIQSNEALGRILTQLSDNPGAQAAIRQYYLRSLADRSFRKHEIKRKNRRGYDTKLQHRNFTNYAQSASYYTAQLEHGWKMADAMSTMREDVKATKGAGREGVRKSEVFEQIARRDQMTTDPQTVSKLVRNGVSFAQFTMLTSPSYWMINATQPYMVSLPYMAAKHSYGATIAAMKSAQSMIAHPLIRQAVKSKGGLVALWDKVQTEEAFNVLDQVKSYIKQRSPDRADSILSMLDELRRESILDLSWIAELRDISEGADTGWWQKTLDASRIMSHLTEVNNRIMTAIAAYNLASADGTHEQAVEYAKEVVAGTHFDYSSGAKPLLFRPDGPLGSMAPLVFQFMQWPQHMYAMLISNMVKVFKSKGVERKEAAKILGGLLGTHMLAGGIIGAALQPIKWGIGLAMMALGDDDEPYTFTNAVSGETFDRLVQEGIATVAGPGVAELLSRGVPATLGSDLSDRMSLGTLYFMDLRPESMESTLGSLAMSLGGPWLTIGENGFRAVQDLAAGEQLRAAERVAPKALRDVLKTYRYASEGVVSNAGDTVISGDGLPPLELFLQGVGFSSSTVGNFYNKQAAIKDVERYGAERADSLVERFARAESAEDRGEILKQVAEFNKQFPAARITRSRLVQSLKSKSERESSYRRHGANLRGKSQAYADEGWYFR